MKTTFGNEQILEIEEEDNNPMRQPGVPEKGWKTRRERYPSGFKDPDQMKGDKNPMKNPVHLAAMVAAKRKARIKRK